MRLFSFAAVRLLGCSAVCPKFCLKKLNRQIIMKGLALYKWGHDIYKKSGDRHHVKGDRHHVKWYEHHVKGDGHHVSGDGHNILGAYITY